MIKIKPQTLESQSLVCFSLVYNQKNYYPRWTGHWESSLKDLLSVKLTFPPNVLDGPRRVQTNIQ